MRQLAEFKRYRAHLCAGLAHSDSDDEMLRRVAQWVVPSMDCGDGGWWIVDDTGFPKQGIHSVGVARQCCCKPGKRDNCQVAVSVSRWLARAAACPWLGACTCPRIGAKTRRVATRPAFPRTSGLRACGCALPQPCSGICQGVRADYAQTQGYVYATRSFHRRTAATAAARCAQPCCCSRKRCASSAAMQPVPAEVMAWR
jgi:hypothetical protein